MIKNAKTKICRIMFNGTEISKVYRTKDLVYQNFVNFSIDGSIGTKTGTVSLPQGRYRICMTGGGGGGSGYYIALARISRTTYYGFWASSAGAAIYGILSVPKRTVYSYNVGAIGCDTSFGTLICGAGATANSSNCKTSGGGDDVRPIALDGGVVQNVNILESVAIASNGNSGGTAFAYNSQSPKGGSSLLSYDAKGDYTAINYSWGKGSDFGTNNATAGFLSVVKIS